MTEVALPESAASSARFSPPSDPPSPGGTRASGGRPLEGWLARLAQLPPEKLGGQISRIEALEPRSATLARFELPSPYPRILARRGIEALYSHQAAALEHWRAGHDVLLSTGTASGKSLVYNLATALAAQAEPGARALFLFPLKALAQDQLAGVRADFEALGPIAGVELSAELYDGDTSPYRRKRIREQPPTVILSNPDMLHLGILPKHDVWAEFFAKLRTIVIDEVHSYRGVFGAHTAQVLRRLLRVARHYGAEPRVISCSATIANPGPFIEKLTGRAARVVSEDGSPQPGQLYAFVEPKASPYTAASHLFRRCVQEGLRTIAFTQSRQVTELMHSWILEADPTLARRVSSYRAGFLPEERREIEGRLFRGELGGVIATSALELGIDVGGLDVCILVGYPGSILAARQRAGRVARARQGLVFLVPQQDALDRYFLTHPRELLERSCEDAVVDPGNLDIAAGHLPCAAAELPLRRAEDWLDEPGLNGALEHACQSGELLEAARGGEYFAARTRPHRHVSLRSVGEAFTIRRAAGRAQGKARDAVIGTVGSGRAFAECHEGAIYLHRARPYQVVSLDLERREARVRGPSRVDYYTRAVGEKETEILEVTRTRPLGNALLKRGRLKITQRITHYEKRRTLGQDLISKHPLELPPRIYETEGLWFEIAPEAEDTIAAAGGHFMGAIHGLEHAMLALFPLYALCDRFDVAGISIPRHPQVRGPAIFLYDGAPGGIGICRSVFPRVEALLEATEAAISSCDCLEGCPSCIHSPRCSNGNRPLDKPNCARIARLILGVEPLQTEALAPEEPPFEPIVPPALEPVEAGALIFDVETQRSAQEVGGWHNAHLMRVALAVVYDTLSGEFTTYREADVEQMIERFFEAPAVVGFNSRRFDYRVLSAYSARDFGQLKTFDLLEDIHARLGYRLSLDHLGVQTLERAKTADGLQSLEWWKSGEIDKIEAYCREDVALVRDLIDYAGREGHVLFQKKNGPQVRLPVDWSLETILERAG